VTTLNELDVWLGLKNSDDQGTSCDLQAEVYKNAILMTAGLTRCITGVTRNADQAKNVTVAFPSFAPVDFNGTTRPAWEVTVAGETLSLRQKLLFKLQYKGRERHK
jgi:hypothetical protein